MGKGMMRIIFSYFLSVPVPVPDLICAFYFAACGNLLFSGEVRGTETGLGTYRGTSDYDAGGS